MVGLADKKEEPSSHSVCKQKRSFKLKEKEQTNKKPQPI